MFFMFMSFVSYVSWLSFSVVPSKIFKFSKLSIAQYHMENILERILKVWLVLGTANLFSNVSCCVRIL